MFSLSICDESHTRHTTSLFFGELSLTLLLKIFTNFTNRTSIRSIETFSFLKHCIICSQIFHRSPERIVGRRTSCYLANWNVPSRSLLFYISLYCEKENCLSRPPPLYCAAVLCAERFWLNIAMCVGWLAERMKIIFHSRAFPALVFSPLPSTSEATSSRWSVCIFLHGVERKMCWKNIYFMKIFALVPLWSTKLWLFCW